LLRRGGQLSSGHVQPGHLDGGCTVGHAVGVELVACRLHDATGDDLGLIELPLGCEL
jgi:hypothetical protein